MDNQDFEATILSDCNGKCKGHQNILYLTWHISVNISDMLVIFILKPVLLLLSLLPYSIFICIIPRHMNHIAAICLNTMDIVSCRMPILHPIQIFLEIPLYFGYKGGALETLEFELFTHCLMCHCGCVSVTNMFTQNCYIDYVIFIRS